MLSRSVVAAIPDAAEIAGGVTRSLCRMCVTSASW
jgi:hypothetical protein